MEEKATKENNKCKKCLALEEDHIGNEKLCPFQAPFFSYVVDDIKK